MTEYNLKYHNMIKMKNWQTSMHGNWKNINDIVQWRKALMDGITLNEQMNNSLISRFVL
jgi:hypothetical protein